jgi:hypothetical protein
MTVGAIEVDNVAPVWPRIDVADCAAFGAPKMCADLAPIPIRKIGKPQQCVVSADRAALLRADAIDDDVDEAPSPINRAVPVAKPSCGFSTPRHGASKRIARLSANRATTSQELGTGAGTSYSRSRVLISRRALLAFVAP